MSSKAAATLLVALLVLNNSATADTFGSGSNQFSIDFRAIGNPNNPADTTGDPNPAGAVSYEFRMGTYEISEDMIYKANALGNLAITIISRGANKPATAVSWNEAARFVNWLNTNSGYSAAYKFSSQPGSGGYDPNANILLWQAGDAGYNAANPFRNSNAFYFLPTTDEWYKAAYYNAAGTNYFWYATGGNVAPTAVTGGTNANTAVYDPNVATTPADVTNAGGLSPYGTMGQGGNTWEFMETSLSGTNNDPTNLRVERGGSWDNYDIVMRKDSISNLGPSVGGGDIGFRVASIPEPSTCALLMLGGGVLWWLRSRRK